MTRVAEKDKPDPFSSMCWKVAICWMTLLSFWNSKATLRGPWVSRCSRRSSALYGSRHCLLSNAASLKISKFI